MTSKIPQEYSALSSEEIPTLSGTDLYLACVTAFITTGIVHTGFNIVNCAHAITIPPLFILMMCAITSLVSGYHAVTHRYDRFFRLRVWNSVKHGLNVVFLSPFTMPAQIGQTTTTDFYINQNLFD